MMRHYIAKIEERSNFFPFVRIFSSDVGVGCDAMNVLCLWWEKEESKNYGIRTSSWKDALSIGKADDGHKFLGVWRADDDDDDDNNNNNNNNSNNNIWYLYCAFSIRNNQMRINDVKQESMKGRLNEAYITWVKKFIRSKLNSANLVSGHSMS